MFVTRLALRYRQRFHKDVVIDLVVLPPPWPQRGRRALRDSADACIASSASTRLRARCMPTSWSARGCVLSRGAGDVRQYRAASTAGRLQPRASLGLIGNKYTVDWTRVRAGRFGPSAYDRSRPARLRALGERLTRLPNDLVAAAPRGTDHRQPRQDVRGRDAARLGRGPRRSPTRLLDEGVRGAHLRSGQRPRHLLPSPRGAARSEDRTPFHSAAAHQGRLSRAFTVIDSVLSEEAVVGFEYG